MRRAVRLLRSCWKEERFNPLDRAVMLRAAGVCLLVFTPLVALQLAHRSIGQWRHQQAIREDTVALMEVVLAGTDRAARDWGHWDPVHRFARGTNPDFPRTQLDTAALFEAGTVMLLLRADGTRLLTHAAPGFLPQGDGELLRCARDNTARLRTLRSTVRLACPAGDGSLYLGTATTISDDSATAVAAGTLVILEPLLNPGYPVTISRRLETLQRELEFRGIGPPVSSAADARILPLIHSTGGSVLAMRRPAVLPILGHVLLEDLPLLAAIPLLALILRAAALLRRRRRRIVQRWADRRANRRIHEACLTLDRLLEGLVPMDRLAGDSRLTGRPSLEAPPVQVPTALAVDPVSPGMAGSVHERELARVTGRVQRFLRSASSLALLDSLTHLPNRRYFIAHVAETAALHRRLGESFALLFVDVDKFKVINDTYGHAVGDAVLITVSQRLRAVLGPADFLARYGGDELAVILDLSHLEDRGQQSCARAARQRANAMVDSLLPPVRVGDLSLAVSLSIGITLVEPQESDIAAVIQRSDLAMYQAKRSRNSRIVGPDDVDQEPRLSRYQLFTELIEAIRDQRLQVEFQPIVRADRSLHGVEALARWHHPQRGWIEPLLFLEMAEQHRQMPLLGDELIRLSLDGFQLLRQRWEGLRLYLNLAPNQLLDPGLAERLLLQLSARDLPASQLTLELTEHSILEPREGVQANLTTLRQAGVLLALDDFGTGYASLLLLRTLRPDVVKIDKSFIQSMHQDSHVQPILSLIASLAPQLGLDLIAEGIEDAAALEQLERLGIGLFQGFEFGRPRPIQDWLQDGDAAMSADSRAIV